MPNGQTERMPGNLKTLIGEEKIEPLDIVNTVNTYRQYWKPDNVKVILLAESHVYTSTDDFRRRLNLEKCGLQSYPDRYVRFVYCLGYGEDGLVDKKLANNHGTTDFWKIFFSACNPVTSLSDFQSILKGTTPFRTRIANKIGLIRQMREMGIWLLDASIIGINNNHHPSPKTYVEVLSICWHQYIRNIIEESAPDRIICIGKGVSKVLEGKIKSLMGKYPVSVPLPNAHLSASERMNIFAKIYETCAHHSSAASRPLSNIQRAPLGDGTNDHPTGRTPKGHQNATTRKDAIKWLHDKCGIVEGPVYYSRYYPSDKSYTRAPSWAHTIPRLHYMTEGSKWIHLLCQKKNNPDDYYYLRVPSEYVREKEVMLFVREEKMVSIFLSAVEGIFMQDQRGSGKIDFAQFLIEVN